MAIEGDGIRLSALGALGALDALDEVRGALPLQRARELALTRCPTRELARCFTVRLLLHERLALVV
jgi:hypothetical protein